MRSTGLTVVPSSASAKACAISSKFITLFAFMFGIGFAIQMDRAAARGQRSVFYLRRLAVLFAFGILHLVLLWWGDILAVYAMMGFVLPKTADAEDPLAIELGAARALLLGP